MELHLDEAGDDSGAGVSHHLELVVEGAEGGVEEAGGLGEAGPVILGGASVVYGEKLGVEEEVLQLGSNVRQEGRNH